MKGKRSKKAKHRNTERRKARAKGDEDTKQRRKFARGGRIEAYTFGETTSKKGGSWPF